MTDHHIDMRAHEVRALLREAEAPGTGKTQTRRPISPRNTLFDGGSWPKGRFAACDWSGAWVDPGPSPAGNPGPYLKVEWPWEDDTLVSRVYPAIQPGDRLWVREAWRTASAYDDIAPSDMGGDEPVRYEADGAWETWGWGAALRSGGRYRHARFMPRWASRLTLTVTGVRVQRLQEITEADAVAEGLQPLTRKFPEMQMCKGALRHRQIYEWPGGWSVDAVPAYRALWNRLHGPDAWEANPWVTALTFTVALRNIDGEPT